MNKLLSAIAGAVALTLSASADTNSWYRILDFKYEPAKQTVGITSEAYPSTSRWKINFTDELRGTNTVWKEYANILQGGRTNYTKVYSPSPQRYFRLKEKK